MSEQKTKLHNLVLENRRRLVMSGVKEVEGFTESEVRLFTDMGQLTVKGKNLKVEQVSTDSGEMIMTGDLIQLLIYSEKTEHSPDNFITRLFR